MPSLQECLQPPLSENRREERIPKQFRALLDTPVNGSWKQLPSLVGQKTRFPPWNEISPGGERSVIHPPRRNKNEMNPHNTKRLSTLIVLFRTGRIIKMPHNISWPAQKPVVDKYARRVSYPDRYSSPDVRVSPSTWTNGAPRTQTKECRVIKSPIQANPCQQTAGHFTSVGNNARECPHRFVVRTGIAMKEQELRDTQVLHGVQVPHSQTDGSVVGCEMFSPTIVQTRVHTQKTNKGYLGTSPQRVGREVRFVKDHAGSRPSGKLTLTLCQLQRVIEASCSRPIPDLCLPRVAAPLETSSSRECTRRCRGDTLPVHFFVRLNETQMPRSSHAKYSGATTTNRGRTMGIDCALRVLVSSLSSRYALLLLCQDIPRCIEA